MIQASSFHAYLNWLGEPIPLTQGIVEAVYKRLQNSWAPRREVSHGIDKFLNVVSTFLQDVVQATELDGRKVVTVRIAGPILHGAGNADHFLDPAEIRRHLFVRYWPVDIKPVQAGGSEINVP